MPMFAITISTNFSDKCFKLSWLMSLPPRHISRNIFVKGKIILKNLTRAKLFDNRIIWLHNKGYMFLLCTRKKYCWGHEPPGYSGANQTHDFIIIINIVIIFIVIIILIIIITIVIIIICIIISISLLSDQNYPLSFHYSSSFSSPLLFIKYN